MLILIIIKILKLYPVILLITVFIILEEKAPRAVKPMLKKGGENFSTWREVLKDVL